MKNILLKIGIIIGSGLLLFGLIYTSKPSNNLQLGSTILYPNGGGTGTSTAPTYGKVLVGNSSGTYTLTATSSLGISGGASLSGGSLNALTYWTGGTTVSATSSPTIGWLNATTSNATSTFAGGLSVGSTGFYAQNNGIASIGLPTKANINLRIQSTMGQLPLVFTGTGVSTGSGTDDNKGVMMGMGYNSTGVDTNKQLWIGSSGQIGDSSKTIFRFITGFDIPMIDGVAADGSTRRNINFGYTDNNIGIGYDVVTASQADILAKLDIIGNSGGGTVIRARGGSSGFTLLSLDDGGVLSLPSPTYSGNGDQYLCVDNAGEVSPSGFLCNPSTLKVKQDVKPLNVDALSMLSNFQPVSFEYTKASHQKSTNPTGTQWGFIAEYMASSSKNLAAYNTKGQVATLDDRAISAVVVKAVQQMWGIVQSMLSRLTGDEARISKLEQIINLQQQEINSLIKK